MKNFHKILLAFCLLFGGASTTSDAKPNSVGAFIAALLGFAVVKMVVDNSNVFSAFKKVGVAPGEAEVVATTLVPLSALGFFGVEQGAYLAKWGVAAMILAKIILSRPAQYLLHNIPLVGETIVPRAELRERGDSEQTSRFTLALIAMASPPAAQCLAAYLVSLAKNLDTRGR